MRIIPPSSMPINHFHRLHGNARNQPDEPILSDILQLTGAFLLALNSQDTTPDGKLAHNRIFKHSHALWTQLTCEQLKASFCPAKNVLLQASPRLSTHYAWNFTLG